ncbi:MAG TPA: CsiV family protein [Steroidobacteraceae bacterium]|nr:CsiV family protein [Steroidobacteraceae bacterium]
MPVERVSRRQVVLGLAALSAVPTALADTPPPAGSARYHVEIIVFRQPGPSPTAVPAGPLPVTATIPGRVTLLPDADWQLASLAEALARRAGYTLLAHAAWEAIVPPNGRTTARLEDLLADNSQLAGAIAVQRGQHLFLGVDIDYRPPSGAVPEGATYSLRERRRIKFGERHYFDHPAFGVIIEVAAPRGAVESG